MSSYQKNRPNDDLKMWWSYLLNLPPFRTKQCSSWILNAALFARPESWYFGYCLPESLVLVLCREVSIILVSPPYVKIAKSNYLNWKFVYFVIFVGVSLEMSWFVMKQVIIKTCWSNLVDHFSDNLHVFHCLYGCMSWLWRIFQIKAKYKPKYCSAYWRWQLRDEREKKLRFYCAVLFCSNSALLIVAAVSGLNHN